MAEIAPPEYAGAVSAIQSLGVNASPSDIKKALESAGALSVDPPPSYEPPTFTPEQLQKFSTTLVDGMSSDKGKDYIKETLKQVNETTKQTDKMFGELVVKLAEIDSKYTSPDTGAFGPKLVAIKNNWFTAMLKSRDLAMEISNYGKRFAELIIPLADDKNMTIDFKLKKLQEFIDKAHKFETDSTAMMTIFNGVRADFQMLVGTFSSWASKKSEDLKEKLKRLGEELAELQKAIDKKNIEMIGVGAGAAATLPVTGVAAALAGPFAPFVIIGGLVAAGALTATFIVLSQQLSKLKGQKADKQKEIQAVELEIKEIDALRKQLQELGAADLVILQGNISALGYFWTYARGDAVKIQLLLKDAQGDIDWPTAFNMHKDKAIILYSTMADYLEEYAKGMPVS